jgi:predicted PurR-regulated permease PerM
MTDKLRRTRFLQRNSSLAIQGLFILGIFYTVYLARAVLLPITAAFVVSLLLAPLVNWAHRHGVPRVLAATGIVAASVLGLAVTVLALEEPARDWLRRAPQTVQQLLDQTEALQRQLRIVQRSTNKVDEILSNAVSDKGDAQSVDVERDSWRTKLLASLGEVAAATVLSIALIYFLLVSGDKLVLNIIRQVQNRRLRKPVIRVFRRLKHDVSLSLAIMAVNNLAVGAVLAIVLWLIGLPNAMLWGMLAAVLRFIPYLGMVLMMALLITVSAATFDQAWQILLGPLSYWLLTAGSGLLIEPHLFGQQLSINPVVIFLSLFLWGWIWGAVGALLAVPLLTIVRAICYEVDSLRPLARAIAA